MRDKSRKTAGFLPWKWHEPGKSFVVPVNEVEEIGEMRIRQHASKLNAKNETPPNNFLVHKCGENDKAGPYGSLCIWNSPHPRKTRSLKIKTRSEADKMIFKIKLADLRNELENAASPEDKRKIRNKIQAHMSANPRKKKQSKNSTHVRREGVVKYWSIQSRVERFEYEYLTLPGSERTRLAVQAGIYYRDLYLKGENQ